MKRLSLKEVQDLLKKDVHCFIQINEFTRKIRLVRYNAGCFDEIIGYLTFNQFMKLDLCNSLIGSVIFDYFKLRKECK